VSGNQNDQKDHELITTIQKKNEAKSQRAIFNAKALELAWDHYFPPFAEKLFSENPDLSESLLEKFFTASYCKLEENVKSGKIRATDEGAVQGVSSVFDYLVEQGKIREEELTKPVAGNEDDHQGIKAIKQDITLILLKLNRVYFEYFNRYARKKYSTFSEEDRKDIHQESMYVLVKNINSDSIKTTDSTIYGLVKTAKLITFYMSIAINWLNKFTKRKPTTDLDSIKELDDDPDGNWGFTEEDFEKLGRAFAQLDDDTAQMLDLWSRSFSMREIAEMIGLKDENNARVKAFRCRKKLREIFEQLP
jgi:DNA-directed RNA polymerase specialized sigma24 family protein